MKKHLMTAVVLSLCMAGAAMGAEAAYTPGTYTGTSSGHEDGITVTVTVDADPRNFIVKIADTGVGIPEESLDMIYERFYRVDKSRSREVGGSGLGLSITKSAVLLHRGTIQAESKEGEGTTFTVTIPLNYVQRAADPAAGKRA